MASPVAQALRLVIDKFKQADTDLYAYCGPIDRSGYAKLCRAIPKKDRKSNALLVLCTRGGDPHAGYRIARALIHHYSSENLHILVPGPCKSAGTLICVGAHQLIICDSGELGPLDVQLQKQDEMFQLSSGLDIIRGLTYLQDQTFQAYAQYVVAINDSGLSTKIASDIASRLVTGIFEPMFAQIDPSRLGEMNAALAIASDYGSRLQETSKALKTGALHKLIHKYPAHGFVIDRKEARTLFQNVARPSPFEDFMGTLVLQHMWGKGNSDEPRVENLSLWLQQRLQAEEEEGKAAEQSASIEFEDGAQQHSEPEDTDASRETKPTEEAVTGSNSSPAKEGEVDAANNSKQPNGRTQRTRSGASRAARSTKGRTAAKTNPAARTKPPGDTEQGTDPKASSGKK